MCHFIVSIDCGQYFSALLYVNPGHELKFPFFIALSHVDRTGNPAAACIYLTSASMLGKSYKLLASGLFWLVVV